MVRKAVPPRALPSVTDACVNSQSSEPIEKPRQIARIPPNQTEKAPVAPRNAKRSCPITLDSQSVQRRSQPAVVAGNFFIDANSEESSSRQSTSEYNYLMKNLSFENYEVEDAAYSSDLCTTATQLLLTSSTTKHTIRIQTSSLVYSHTPTSARSCHKQLVSDLID